MEATLNSRFYSRPYICCPDCDSASTFKCRSCLFSMATTLKTQESQGRTTFRTHNKKSYQQHKNIPIPYMMRSAQNILTCPNTAPAPTSQQKRYAVQYRIKNKYQLYLQNCMERKYLPRSEQDEEHGWQRIHRKKIKYTIEQSTAPKFEKWNKKSFDRIKNTLLSDLIGTAET